MKIKAIANCRVSTAEQKQSNSLNRQQSSVMRASQELDAEIIKEWSGDVSSKAGTNVKRRDIREMLDFCRKNRAVKYLIVDEPDRFMRSVDEAFHFEVEFRMVGVKVWYASDPELNTDDMTAKLMKFMKYFAAESSNEERQRKSVTGHRAAVKEGRYTFPPLPGYMHSDKPGVHVFHPIQGVPFQQALKSIANRMATPSEALKQLNKTEFISNGRTPMKIDKFVKFIVNPYYCGIIVVGKQVNARCENGLHTPMISKEEHDSIVEVINGRKIRSFRKLQYNPNFPMNKLLIHDCQPGAKFTGSNQGNGNGKFYPKYRCRKCGKQYHRQDVHKAITNILLQVNYQNAQQKDFMRALATVWNKKQQDNIRSLKTLQRQRESLEIELSGLYRELAKVTSEFKDGIQAEIRKIQLEISELSKQIADSNKLQGDLVEFVKFGLEYSNRLKTDWWELNQDERTLCQQLLFPDGIIFNSNKKVSTNSICTLYRLTPNKKDLRITRKSLLVELEGIAPSSMKN